MQGLKDHVLTAPLCRVPAKGGVLAVTLAADIWEKEDGKGATYQEPWVVKNQDIDGLIPKRLFKASDLEGI